MTELDFINVTNLTNLKGMLGLATQLQSDNVIDDAEIEVFMDQILTLIHAYDEEIKLD